MREVNIAAPQPIEISEQPEQRKGERLVFTGRIHRGHKLFKLRLSDMKLTELIEEDYLDPVLELGRTAPRRRVKMREGYLYASALNQKNAARRFLKMLSAPNG